jgi:hypothetical protein
MGRRGVAVAGAVLAVAMAIAACSANDPPGGEGRLSIATGGSGGVYLEPVPVLIGFALLGLALVLQIGLRARTA